MAQFKLLVRVIYISATSLSLHSGEGSEQQDSAGRRGSISAGGSGVKVQETLNSVFVTSAVKRAVHVRG